MNLVPFLERLRADHYRALAGTEAFVKVPLRESVVNEFVETVILPSRPALRAMRVAFLDGNLVDVTMVSSRRWVPTVTVPFEIEPHVAMGPSPIVRLHLRQVGIVGRLASFGLAWTDRLPPGVRFAERVMEIDLGTLLAGKDAWQALGLLQQARLTTESSTLWIEMAFGIAAPATA